MSSKPVLRYTPAGLAQLEAQLRQTPYRLRYGKGSFRSGACVMRAQKVLVVNSFLPLETRIDFLFSFLQQEGLWAGTRRSAKGQRP